MSAVAYYIEGSNRVGSSERTGLSHTYAVTCAGNYWPMCGYGWNRSDGHRFSIWRGPPGTEGDCALCRKNVSAGKRPHHKPFPHKTKWI